MQTVLPWQHLWLVIIKFVANFKVANLNRFTKIFYCILQQPEDNVQFVVTVTGEETMPVLAVKPCRGPAANEENLQYCHHWYCLSQYCSVIQTNNFLSYTFIHNAINVLMSLSKYTSQCPGIRGCTLQTEWPADIYWLLPDHSLTQWWN